MKSIVHSAQSRDKLLHIEVDGCVVNIRVGLTDADGRKVTSIEILAEDESRSPDNDGRHWHLDGHVNSRVVRTPDAKEALSALARVLNARVDHNLAAYHEEAREQIRLLDHQELVVTEIRWLKGEGEFWWSVGVVPQGMRWRPDESADDVASVILRSLGVLEEVSQEA